MSLLLSFLGNAGAPFLVGGQKMEGLVCPKYHVQKKCLSLNMNYRCGRAFVS